MRTSVTLCIRVSEAAKKLTDAQIQVWEKILQENHPPSHQELEWMLIFSVILNPVLSWLMILVSIDHCNIMSFCNIHIGV